MLDELNNHNFTEIGGYFGLEQLISDEYYKNLKALNTARNALLYVLKAKNIRKLYIPYYLCDSINYMLNRNGYDLEYYKIDVNFNPIFNRSLDENEYLYIVNYFGQITNKKAAFFKEKYGNIILDNAMAFFQKPIKGIDTIYSCRKFFGVPDGAYVSTDTPLETELDFTSSKDRMKHLLGRYEGTASDYYSDFKNNESSYKVEPLKYMSKISKNILGAIDYERVRQIRNENFCYLANRLDNINKLRFIAPDGAFSYPFYIDNGLKIRNQLAEKKIYVPTLWPNVLSRVPENSVEYRYASNILPLPCDQRYCSKDLDFICSKLMRLMKK